MSFKKVVLVVSFLAVFGFAFNFGLPSAKAMSVAQLQALIQQLQSQIQALQQQLAQLQGQPATWCHNFNITLHYGDRGNEVRALQTALKKLGLLSDEEIGRDGQGYFGQNTAAAVVDFQLKNRDEISKYAGYRIRASGVFGKGTRTKMNKLYGCGVVSPAKILYKTKWDSGRLTTSLLRSDDGGKTWKVIRTQYKGGITYATDSKNPKIIYAGDTGGNMMAEYLGIDLVKSYNGGDSWIDISKGVIEKDCDYSASPPVCSQKIAGTDKKLSGIDSIWVDPSNSNIVKVTVTSFGGEKITFKSTNGGLSWTRETAVKSYIQVLSPNGGEKWEIGKTYEIRWNSVGVDKVAISVNGNVVADAVPASLGRYSWEILGPDSRIPGPFKPGNYYKVRIEDTSDTSVYDTSDNYFSIVEATTACYDSDGGINSFLKGTVTYGGKTYTDYCFGAFALKEYYCSAGGVAEEDIICDGNCRDGACVVATTTPYIQVLSPNGGERWERGNTYLIEWTSQSVDRVNIELEGYESGCTSPAGGPLTYRIASNIPASQNEYRWTIPSSIAIKIFNKIRIVDASTANLPYSQQRADSSDDCFSIVTTTTGCTDSDGGINSYVKGTVTEDGKSRTDYCGGLDWLVEYYCASPYTKLGSKILSEFITCPSGYICQDGACIKSEKGIQVLSPNGGETLVKGNTYTVRWESKGVNRVRIYIFNPNISGSGSTNYIVPGNEPVSASLGYYNWTVGETGLPSGVDQGAVYKIRIDDVDSNLSDSSDNYFSIVAAGTSTCTDSDGGKNYYVKGKRNDGAEDHCHSLKPNKLYEMYCTSDGRPAYEIYTCPYGCQDGACKPGITVLSPNGGETLVKGDTYTVKWESKGVNQVKIYIFNPSISGSGSTNYIVPNNQPVSASLGYYNWTVSETGLPSGVGQGAVYKIRIDDVDSNLSDESDNYFSIVAPTTTSLQDIQNQLASISAVIPKILERIKGITSR